VTGRTTRCSTRRKQFRSHAASTARRRIVLVKCSRLTTRSASMFRYHSRNCTGSIVVVVVVVVVVVAAAAAAAVVVVVFSLNLPR